MSETSNCVCSDCMRGDEILSDLVRTRGQHGNCSYCSRNAHPVLPISDVAIFVLDHIKTVYEPRTVNLIEVFKPNLDIGTNDILAEVLDYQGDVEGMLCNRELIGDLCAAIDALIAPQKAWMRPDNYDLPWSWRDFVGEITYRRRFLFLSTAESNDSSFRPRHTAAEVLKIIADALVEMDLIASLDAGGKLCRARVAKNGENFSGERQLGAPSPEQAKAGRMNPPGIPYFYAASDHLTACAEVCGDIPETLNTVYVSTWEIKKNMKLIDLSKLGKLPSFFIPENRKSRATHIFLRDFIRDVCAPPPVYDMAQLTYIPAQVVSEYFRTAFRLGRDNVDGVIFTSTKNPQGKCVVMFPINDDDDPQYPFHDKLKLCSPVEEKLVGVEPDLVIPRVVEKDLSSPWEISAHKRLAKTNH